MRRMVVGLLVLAACPEHGAGPGDADVVSDAAMIDGAAVQLTVTPASLDLGAQIPGCSIPRTVTVSNPGSAASGPLSTTISGTGASEFAFSANGCAGHSLGPGESCAIAIGSAWMTTGGKTAVLEISAPSIALMVSLSATNISASRLSVSPMSTDFGTVAPGETSSVTTITVTDVAPCATGAFSVSRGGTYPMEFPIAFDNCTGVALGTNESCTIGVTYAPSGPGPKSAVIDVVASPGGTVHAAFTGH